MPNQVPVIDESVNFKRSRRVGGSWLHNSVYASTIGHHSGIQWRRSQGDRWRFFECFIMMNKFKLSKKVCNQTNSSNHLHNKAKNQESLFTGRIYSNKKWNSLEILTSQLKLSLFLCVLLLFWWLLYAVLQLPYINRKTTSRSWKHIWQDQHIRAEYYQEYQHQVSQPTIKHHVRSLHH